MPEKHGGSPSARVHPHLSFPLRIQWLFNASTALFPSVYLSRSGRDRDAEFLFIQAKLQEAARVAQGRNVVYPYLWYRYRDAGFLSDVSTAATLATPPAAP